MTLGSQQLTDKLRGNGLLMATANVLVEEPVVVLTESEANDLYNHVQMLKQEVNRLRLRLDEGTGAGKKLFQELVR